MGIMCRLFSREIFKKRSISDLRILWLIGALISFCFLFAQVDIGLNTSKNEGNNYGVSLYAGSPAVLQINVRFNQLILLDCDKNKKISAFNKLKIAGGYFPYTHDQLLTQISGFNSIIHGTFKLRYLLLDLPPPSIRSFPL
jgi:hypothetical protein